MAMDFYCGLGSWWRWRVVMVVGVGFIIGLRCWLVFSGLFKFLLLGVFGLFMMVMVVQVICV